MYTLLTSAYVGIKKETLVKWDRNKANGKENKALSWIKAQRTREN